MKDHPRDIQSLTQAFSQTTRTPRRTESKQKAQPFTIRLTDDERGRLEALAGSKPLGAYIRDELLGERQKKRRKHRQPHVNEKAIAGALAALGASRLSSNVNQLAKSVNLGTLKVSDDVEKQLQDASLAILAMRDALIQALGLKST